MVLMHAIGHVKESQRTFRT